MKHAFIHPFVADLAWLVEGHYIEQDFDLKLYWVDDVEARLIELDRHPERLVDVVEACKSHFLGSYFETLFSFAMAHLSTLTPVLEHFQIESEGRTLGEVDILVESPDGELHQFEIAIKFYLERPDLAPYNWIGPNKNDSLLKKVTRAREHQLSILQTPEGASFIQSSLGSRKVHMHLLLFGRLYSDLNQAEDLASWVEQSEGESKRGGWVRESKLTQMMPHFSQFCVLNKPHWMAIPNTKRHSIFFSEESVFNLIGEFLQDERPKHLLLTNKEEDRRQILFVVPDSW